jgi:quinol-cytochrome oxidoreductase complex cytochrome b subunit
LLKVLQSSLRAPLRILRRVLDSGFVPVSLNPLRHLGSLTIFFCWIVLVSGIWLFIFFRTSVTGAYESVEYLTHNQWYLGGVMRSLHRYASDAAIITLFLHIVREFAFDRHRGNRWFSWVTGMPLLWLLIPLGITGYWLVWDQLAQYVALASAELIDWLPIFTDSMARNFLSDEALSDRFFTLMAFLHLIGLPLFLVFGIWLHVLRINGPEVNPPRVLMSGSLLAMLLLSLVFPALSQGQADLASVPGSLGLDWYYLLIYPLINSWDVGWVWALLAGISLLLAAAPWLPPKRPQRVVEVSLDNCNGCERCVVDCPFGALTMEPRSDGKAYETEAVVDPELCLSCGICVGACPTATPFRKRSDLVPGIDLPDHSMAKLREEIHQAVSTLISSQRVLVFSCDDGTNLDHLADSRTAVIRLSCMAQLPPSFLDYVLSRNFVDGVFMAGCISEACQYRFGADWTAQRINRQRDPRLRKRVSGEQVALGWQQPWDLHGRPSEMLAAFRESLGGSEASHGPQRVPPKWKAGIVSKQAVAYAVFAVVVGVFSVWPRYRLIGENQAMVSLTFSHAGQRLQECRRLTQEELMKLPPNMRKPTDCPRERHPVDVTFSVDGDVLYRETTPPSGLWNDGESTVYKRLSLVEGKHELFIGMRDSGAGDAYDFERRSVMNLAAGQHVVVEFEQVSQEFVIR